MVHQTRNLSYAAPSRGGTPPRLFQYLQHLEIIDPCLGVAKKSSAGAVQQRRYGLIVVPFDVMHVATTKEERQLERPRLELIQLDGSGRVGGDQLDSGGTRRGCTIAR